MTNTLLKDMSGTAKRLAKNPAILDQYDDKDLLMILGDKLNAYTPKTDDGENNRGLAIQAVVNRLQQLTSKDTSAIEQQTQDALSAGEQVANATVVLEFHISQPGFAKTINTQTFAHQLKGEQEFTEIEANMQFNRFGTWQLTIGKEYLQPMNTHRNKFVHKLKELSIPSKMLPNGHFLVPVRMIERVDQEVITFIEERDILINEFESQYEVAKEDAKIALGR